MNIRKALVSSRLRSQLIQRLIPALLSGATIGVVGCEAPADGDEVAAQELRTNEAIAIGGERAATVAKPPVVKPAPIVIGGATTGVGKEMQRLHPWVVTIGGTGGLSCRGVLIHPSWVLTAAHCIGPIAGQVSYSRTDPATGAVIGQGTRSFDVNGSHRGMFVHPDYVSDAGFGQPRNDIALIRLATPFTIDQNIQTAGLPLLPSNPGRTGALAVAGHSAPVPAGYDASVKAVVLGPSECSTPNGFMCMKPPTGSVCAGDSGSGFLMNLGGRATVVGIASNMTGGGDCLPAGGELQAADVYAYRGWILSTMGKSLDQVAGQVRLRWTGSSSSSTMSLLCERPGSPLVSVPTDVPGGEIGVDCDTTHAVRVYCQAATDSNLYRFTQRIFAPNGTVTVQPQPFLSLFTVFLADPSTSFQEFSCGFIKKDAVVLPVGDVSTAAL
jgi:hypothetical protein